MNYFSLKYFPNFKPLNYGRMVGVGQLIIILFFVILSIVSSQDWANLNKYRDQNEKLGAPIINEKRVVFIGDSITESWLTFQPEFFNKPYYINRGISGQTTPQMLIRFRSDVIQLKPSVVLILAGINDIAENTGPSNVQDIAGNIISMAELSSSNGIKAIICSILPANEFSWNPKINPVSKISSVNSILKSYAKKNELTFLDYYESMVDENEGLKKEYGTDSVHPNLSGYKLMSVLAEQAIRSALELN